MLQSNDNGQDVQFLHQGFEQIPGTMNSYSRYIAQLETTLKNPLRALESTNFDNINQRFVKYYLPLNPTIDEDYIKQKCKDLKEKMKCQINQLEAALITQSIPIPKL